VGAKTVVVGLKALHQHIYRKKERLKELVAQVLERHPNAKVLITINSGRSTSHTHIWGGKSADRPTSKRT